MSIKKYILLVSIFISSLAFADVSAPEPAFELEEIDTDSVLQSVNPQDVRQSNSDFGFLTEDSYMDTSEILSKTLSEIPSCIEYCVKALVIRCQLTQYGCKYIFTLKVSHNSPDLLTFTHSQIDKSPWREWNTLFGKANKSIAGGIMKAIASIMGVPVLPSSVGGGKYLNHPGYGENSNRLYEVASVGNPAALVFMLMNNMGALEDIFKSATSEVSESVHNESDAKTTPDKKEPEKTMWEQGKEYITDGINSAVEAGENAISEGQEMIQNGIDKGFELIEAGESLLNTDVDTLIESGEKLVDHGKELVQKGVDKGFQYIEDGKNMIEEGADLAESGLNFLKGFPDLEYSLENIDVMKTLGGTLESYQTINQWVSQVTYFKQLFSKLSKFAEDYDHTDNGTRWFCPIDITPFKPYYLSSLDSAGWRMGYPVIDASKSATILNPLSFDKIITTNSMIGNGLLDAELFGYIYPRDGTVNTYENYKGAAVVAKRVSSILEDKSKTSFLRPHFDPGGVGHAGWSKAFPEQTACHVYIANTGTKEQIFGNYAWTQWREYDCYLNNAGVVILSIPLKDACFTPKIPD